jgi:hypothetical protein
MANGTTHCTRSHDTPKHHRLFLYGPIVASSDQDKRLRAELAQGLGYFPASVAAEDVARYREQIAKRKAREEAGIREGGHEHRWDHLREEKRRAEVEAQGRASVADLYE